MQGSFTAPLATTSEAAKRLGFSSPYVRYLALTGAIPYQRIGPLYVFDTADLDAWQEAHAANRAARLIRHATHQTGGRGE